MLLAIDIGNTNITFGLFKGNKIIKRFIIPTKNYNLIRLTQLLHLNRQRANRQQDNEINEIIICSVVPAATRILGKDLKKYLGRQPYIIGKDIVVPIKNLYRYPQQVGQDRLVNAYAAVTGYGAPVIVVDFGTAVTFDVVSKKKEYLGGMILPGLGISLDALAARTALLPKIKLARPQEFIGRDSKNSMLSGIVYGFAALTDDLVMRIKKKIGREAKVIGTGGNIDLIAKYCRHLDRVDKNLTLKGLKKLCHKFIDKPPVI